MSDLPTSKYFSLADLRTLTPARVALGRSGISLPTSAQLAFALDHARARDAVHTPFDAEGVAAAVAAFKREVVHVASRASSRADYLRRPDLGRQLDDACRDLLASQNPAASDVTIVIGDGLSAAAVHAHAVSVLNSLLAQLRPMNVTIGQIILATNARVALGDDIGLLLRARMTVMLIGERPGLSAPDSLGAYVTYDPKPGRTDADRNCVSNIHRAGLGCEEAAFKIAWLVQAGLARGLTGVALKDESGEVRPVAVSREPTMLSGNSAALPP